MLIFVVIDGVVKNEEQNVEDDVQTQLSNTFEAIPSNVNIGGIVEKVANRNEFPKLNFSKETGFPRAKRRDVSSIVRFKLVVLFLCEVFSVV